MTGQGNELPSSAQTPHRPSRFEVSQSFGGQQIYCKGEFWIVLVYWSFLPSSFWFTYLFLYCIPLDLSLAKEISLLVLCAFCS